MIIIAAPTIRYAAKRPSASSQITRILCVNSPPFNPAKEAEPATPAPSKEPRETKSEETNPDKRLHAGRKDHFPLKTRAGTTKGMMIGQIATFSPAIISSVKRMLPLVIS